MSFPPRRQQPLGRGRNPQHLHQGKTAVRGKEGPSLGLGFQERRGEVGDTEDGNERVPRNRGRPWEGLCGPGPGPADPSPSQMSHLLGTERRASTPHAQPHEVVRQPQEVEAHFLIIQVPHLGHRG